MVTQELPPHFAMDLRSSDGMMIKNHDDLVLVIGLHIPYRERSRIINALFLQWQAQGSKPTAIIVARPATEEV